MTTSEVLTVEQDGHVAVLWLDSPERRNAMGPALWADLPVAMQELSDDDEVRSVVVAAKGQDFTVGLDLKAMGGTLAGGGTSQAARARRFLKDVRRLQDAITSLEACAKPVIAAVHGACIGGGLAFAACCDVVIAAREAFFSLPEVRLGFAPRSIWTALWTRCWAQCWKPARMRRLPPNACCGRKVPA